MRKLLAKARTRVGVLVIGGALLTVGGTATAAVVTSSPATDEVSDAETVTTEPTVEAVPEVTVVEPTEAPAVTTETEVPAATVEDVPKPETTPKPPAPPAAEGSKAYDPTAPFTDEAGETYTPAPPPPVDTPPAPQPMPEG